MKIIQLNEKDCNLRKEKDKEKKGFDITLLL